MKAAWILLILLASAILCTPVAAEETGPRLIVSEYRLDPQVLMKGDVGVLTIRLTNTGPDPATINSARVNGVEVTVKQNPYTDVLSLGSGDSITFTYTVYTEAPDGLYYVKSPAALAQGMKGTYQVVVGNPRPNAASAVTVTPEGEGFVVTPSSSFVGTLEPDAQSTIPFMVTPLRQSFIRFRVNYRNGINAHTATVTLPLDPSENRFTPELALTGIRVTAGPGYLRISGNVTNIGLDHARAITLTTGGEATPADPFRVFTAGVLEPDRSTPFEVTFRAHTSVSRVPILLSFKDAQGTTYTDSMDVEFDRQALAEQASEPTRFIMLLVWMLVIVLAAVIIYAWRKG
ncbi:MAG: S-layer protein [Methanomicrobia archaeon]|nr:S-layer protein [Methanomicrobia archaeon]